MLGFLRPSIMVNTTHFLNQLSAGYLDGDLFEAGPDSES